MIKFQLGTATCANVEIVGMQLIATMGERPVYAAVCAECAYTGIRSLFRFYAEADAADHNAQHHGGTPRRKSSLIDGMRS